MVITEFGWIFGLHLVMALWLGILASVWKGRNTWTWIAIGLMTSVMGIILLVGLQKKRAEVEPDMQFQHMDGTRLQ